MSRFTELTGKGKAEDVIYDPEIHPKYGFSSKPKRIAAVYTTVAGMCFDEKDPNKAVYYDKNGKMYPRTVKGADAALKATDVLTGKIEPTKIVLDQDGRTLNKPTWIDVGQDGCYWLGLRFMLRMAGSVPENEMMLNHLSLQADLRTLSESEPHALAIGRNYGLYVAGYNDARKRTPELDLYDIAGDGNNLLLFTFEAIQHSAVSTQQ